MPSTPNPNPYYYFMFSTEQVETRNTIEDGRGRKFECGTVVVGGKRKKFSFRGTSRKEFMKQYPDAKTIAEGYKNKMTFTDCSCISKRGN